MEIPICHCCCIVRGSVFFRSCHIAFHALLLKWSVYVPVPTLHLMPVSRNRKRTDDGDLPDPKRVNLGNRSPSTEGTIRCVVFYCI